MELGIFIVLIAIELFFLIWNCQEKNRHDKQKAIVRIGVLALFILLSLLHIIHFGFRYYALMILFFVQAISGIIFLMRRNKKVKEFKLLSATLKIIGKGILIFILMIPAFLFPQYEPIKTTGAYQIATTKEFLTDVNRTEVYGNSNSPREINVEFWYPKNCTEKCSLLVFSHGSCGLKLTGESMFRELASNGYVVCSVDHPYDAVFSQNERGKITWISFDYFKEFRKVTSPKSGTEVLPLIEKWMDVRTGDINFVLDTILQKTKEADTAKYYQLIDTNRIVLGGHSAGGATVLKVGRIRKDVKAVMAMDAPYFGDIIGIEGENYIWEEEPYPIPLLNVYSDSVWNNFDMSIIYMQNERLLNNPDPNVTNLHIKGVGHLGMTDLYLMAPKLTVYGDGGRDTKPAREYMKEMNQIALDFFNKQ